MTRFRSPLLAVAAALAAASPHVCALEAPESPALPAILDLDTALTILRERGLDVLTAEAAIRSAEGDLQAAGAVPNPTLSGSYGRSSFHGGCTDAAGNAVACPGLPPAYGASLSDNAALSDSLSGKRGLRQDVARAALSAARRSREDALRSLEAQVKQAFIAVLVARDALAFAEEVARSQARAAAISRARFDNGAISEADLARIETAKLEADQSVDSARGTLRSARVALAFLLGVRGVVPEFDVAGGPFEKTAVPPGLVGTTRDSLLATAFERRPDVLAARAQVERSHASVTLAHRVRIPDVTLSLGYAQQGTGPTAITPPTLTVGLSVPLPIFYRQRGEITKAEADSQTQTIALAKAQSTAVSDVESAWAGWVSTKALVDRMNGALLERAKTARDLVEIQYQKGAASLLDLLDAQRTFIATRVEYLQDLGAYWNAVFKLEQAAGVNLR